MNLRSEARDLLVDLGTDKSDGRSTSYATGVDAPGEGSDDKTNKHASGEDEHSSMEEDNEGNNSTPRTNCFREPLANVDVPLGLALAEHDEQQRCREWCKLILEKSAHEHALVAPDEYSVQLNLDKNDKTMIKGSTKAVDDGDEDRGNKRKLAAAAGSTTGNSNSLRPLVERGMDRLWLAQLVEKASARPRQPIRRSKDTLISFKCESVSSVSLAMASLNRGQ